MDVEMLGISREELAKRRVPQSGDASPLPLHVRVDGRKRVLDRSSFSSLVRTVLVVFLCFSLSARARMYVRKVKRPLSLCAVSQTTHLESDLSDHFPL